MLTQKVVQTPSLLLFLSSTQLLPPKTSTSPSQRPSQGIGGLPFNTQGPLLNSCNIDIELDLKKLSVYVCGFMYVEKSRNSENCFKLFYVKPKVTPK